MRDQRTEDRGQEERMEIFDGINGIYQPSPRLRPGRQDGEVRLGKKGHIEPFEVIVF